MSDILSRTVVCQITCNNKLLTCKCLTASKLQFTSGGIGCDNGLIKKKKQKLNKVVS